jgi:hypothetical membrane protein
MATPSWTRASGRTLALSGVVAPLWFTAMVVLQGFLQPDYSHVKLPISALAAWPTGWVQNLNFYVVGALTMIFASALDGVVRPTRWGRAGTVLLFVGGIGLVLAGLFPWKMINGVPTETAPHVVGAITTFAATGVGLVVLSRRLRVDPRWHDLAAYTMYSGIAVLVLFVIVGFFAIDDGTPLHAWAGLLQRLLAVVWFACTIVLAMRARTI